MRCKNCDYALWNLTGRDCPECGTPFRPSEFEFKPGSVKFCCPDCEQAYYGTTYTGHLRPRAFDCVSCGRHLDMDEMVLLPADGWDERSVTGTVAPWIRTGVGFFRRWLGTVGWSYVKPVEFMRGLPATHGLGSAFGFALITQLLIALIGIGLPIIVIVLIVTLSGGGGGGGMGFPIVTILPGFLIVLATIVWTLLWGVLIHATLALTGGTPHPMGRTLSALCFSSGTLAAQVVPCLGPYCLGYIVGIWWLVSAILMVMEGQKTSGVRASLAVLWFPVLSLLLVIGAYVFMIFGVISQTRAMTRNNFAQLQMNLGMDSFLEGAMRDRARTPESMVDLFGPSLGGFPDSELADWAELVNGGDPVQTPVIPGHTPFDLNTLNGVELEAALDALRGLEKRVDAPDGTESMVVTGDLVYCLPDFPLSTARDAEPALWLFVAAGRLVGVSEPTFTVCTFAPEGFQTTTEQFGAFSNLTLSEIGDRLAEQDEVRAGHGLAPIAPQVLELLRTVTTSP